MNKAKTNYWVDLATGVAGVVSAVSGLAFLWPGDPTSSVLGISLRAWSGLHTWSSLALIAGVGVHLVLHWKWMVAMTRQMLAQKGSVQATEPAYAEAAGTGMSRRAFLALSGAAAAVTGLAVAGYKVVSDPGTAVASQDSGADARSEPAGGVACPFGVVNDPYPGRCRHYVDSDGDGVCDYSVAGSGSNLTTGGDGGFQGGMRPRRSGSGRP